DQAAVLNVLANDVDSQGRTLSITGVERPAHGSAVVNAGTTITYTPEAGWTGTVTFHYTMTNGLSGSDTGAVQVSVLAVNHPPAVTNPGPQTRMEDDRVSLPINATDPDGDSLLYTAAGLPPGLVIDPMTGRISGWVGPGAAGSYTASVTADDLRGGTSTISIPWTITHHNHPPVLFRWNDMVTRVGESFEEYPATRDIDGSYDTFTFNVTGL